MEINGLPVESLTPITIKRSDLNVHATFKANLWSLFHNVPALYAALLEGLKEFGVTAQSIKAEVGDGTLGGYNVTFWMFDFRAQVRIRLERAEIQFTNIAQSDLDGFERAFVRLTEALATSSKDFSVSSCAVELGVHGVLEGKTTPEYIRTFVKDVPSLSGPHLGSGAVFYFGEDEETTVRTVTTDLSAVVASGLYLRVYSIFRSSVLPSALRGAVERQVSSALTGLRLVRKETS